MGTQQQQQHPPWLFDLLDAEFDCIKGEKQNNSFCIDCRGNAISKKEGERHQGTGHNVITVMKCSGHYSLRKEDIKRLSLDCSDVHVFVINHKEIIFLNSRQKKDRIEKRNHGTMCCTVCGWTLSAAGLFCSLGCKVRNNEAKVSSMVREESDDGDVGIYVPNSERQRNEKMKKSGSKIMTGKSGFKMSMDKTEMKISVDRKKGNVSRKRSREEKKSDYGDIGNYIQIPKRQRSKRKMKTGWKITMDRDLRIGDGQLLRLAVIIKHTTTMDDKYVSLRKRSRKGTPVRSALKGWEILSY